MKDNQQNLLWTFEAISKKTLSEVEAILFDFPLGFILEKDIPLLFRNRGNCKIRQEGISLAVVFEDGKKEQVNINKNNHQLTIHSSWWYKGKYSFFEKKEGTLIRLEVFNVANSKTWLVPFVIRNKKELHKASFLELVKLVDQKELVS